MANPNPSPATRWKPGHVGNPGGRYSYHNTLESKARKLTDKALEALVLDLAVPDRRAAAACAILDRGWGKPAQAIAAQIHGHLTVSGIDRPPEITETYEEWLERRRTELDAIEQAAITVSNPPEKANGQ